MISIFSRILSDFLSRHFQKIISKNYCLQNFKTNMSGSRHLDRVWNVKLVLNVKCLLLSSVLIVTKFYNLGHIQGIMRKLEEA